MINIKINLDEIKNFRVKVETKQTKFNAGIGDCIKKSTMAISRGAKNNLKNNGSVVTGNLRRGIATNTSQTRGEVHTSNIKYAIWVEEGTDAHVIKPKNKKYLYWKGANHPVKQVNHPGSAEKPYLKPAFEEEKPNFIKALQELTKFD